MDEESTQQPIPVRMLNEYAYCPRLFHLMHVEGRWEENAYTAEGRETHRRVDQLDHVLPAPEDLAARKPEDDDERDEARPTVARSVSLSSDLLGLTAKIDLVSLDASAEVPEAVPVDFKRGSPPDNAERCWEPERVQIMAQGLLLREHGYRCDHGILYFVRSKSRVTVPFTEDLERRTLELLEEARKAQARRDLPPPLEDDPRCVGCSLSGICLPDETLAAREEPAAASTAREPRRLFAPRDDASPLYVQEPGSVVGKRGGELIVKKDGQELGRARLIDVSQLVVCGPVQVTHGAFHSLCDAGTPILHLSGGHWFHGVTTGINLRNAFDRAAQFRGAEDPGRVLPFSRAVVAGKIRNQRTLLLRNATPRPEAALDELERFAKKAVDAADVETLLGIEGMAARHYFGSFSRMLRPSDFDASWDFTARNRRPPRDRVNALLSFGYALLSKECTVALISEGLDPWWGFYHKPRHGRPALALDLMEELRPVVADSAVVTAVNTGMVGANAFASTRVACMLNDRGRKAMIQAFEARLDQLVTHPRFGYRCSWRTVIRLQARLFSRWLRNDIPTYEAITTR